jgi:hypothetical protein
MTGQDDGQPGCPTSSRVYHISQMDSGRSMAPPYHQKKLSNQVKVGQYPSRPSDPRGGSTPSERQLEDTPAFEGQYDRVASVRRFYTLTCHPQVIGQCIWQASHSFQPGAPFIMYHNPSCKVTKLSLADPRTVYERTPALQVEVTRLIPPPSRELPEHSVHTIVTLFFFNIVSFT